MDDKDNELRISGVGSGGGGGGAGPFSLLLFGIDFALAHRFEDETRSVIDWILTMAFPDFGAAIVRSTEANSDAAAPVVGVVLLPPLRELVRSR